MTKKRLTIAVDARVIFDGDGRGVAKTSIAQCRALAEARPDWRFHLFHREPSRDSLFTDLPNVSPHRIDIKGDRFDLWSRIRLPAAVFASRADVFHSPNFFIPPYVPAPAVVTIHDLIPLDLRANEPGVKEWGERTKRSAANAAHVITPSEHAKGRIIELFGIDPAKITVVRWGSISGRANGPPDPGAAVRIRESYGLPAGSKYVLHFGMADPRKNTSRVIEAWSAVPSSLNARLVIVGLSDAAVSRFQEESIHLGCKDSVILRGYSPEEDLPPLLAGAAALCYPSLYEGFGLPILDGFGAGTPVVTGNRTSLPEVAGDAALTVDPLDVNAIADALTKLLTDEEFRRIMIARGIERLKLYDWRILAENFAYVFENVANPSSTRRPT